MIVERGPAVRQRKSSARHVVWTSRGQGRGHRIDIGGQGLDELWMKKDTPENRFPGVDERARAARYSALRTTLTGSSAVTSGWMRIDTRVSPSVLMGSSRYTRRRSTFTPL